MFVGACNICSAKITSGLSKDSWTHAVNAHDKICFVKKRYKRIQEIIDKQSYLKESPNECEIFNWQVCDLLDEIKYLEEK